MIFKNVKARILLFAVFTLLVGGCDSESGGRSIPFDIEFHFALDRSDDFAATQYEMGISQNRYESWANMCPEGAPCSEIPAYRPGRWYLAVVTGPGGCLPMLDLESVERFASRAGEFDVVKTRRTYVLDVSCFLPASPGITVYSWQGGSVSASISESFSVD